MGNNSSQQTKELCERCEGYGRVFNGEEKRKIRCKKCKGTGRKKLELIKIHNKK